jgi:hypothetical protein
MTKVENQLRTMIKMTEFVPIEEVLKEVETEL